MLLLGSKMLLPVLNFADVEALSDLISTFTKYLSNV